MLFIVNEHTSSNSCSFFHYSFVRGYFITSIVHILQNSTILHIMQNSAILHILQNSEILHMLQNSAILAKLIKLFLTVLTDYLNNEKTIYVQSCSIIDQQIVNF